MSSCPICLEPELTVPAACVPCGHTFCHSCITQWTLTNRHFSLSLCPQCRAPVRQVQKLFISDWPVMLRTIAVTGVGSRVPSPLSPWRQFVQGTLLLLHIAAARYDAIAHYLPEWLETLYRYVEQSLERLVAWKQRMTNCAGRCWLAWCDLDRGSQVVVVSGVGLAVLLLVEDLSQKDGVHRGVVLPILALMAHGLQQLLCVAAFLVYRPLVCCLACGTEIATAMVDMGAVAAAGAVWVMYDALSLPWLLLTVLGHLLHNILAGCMSLLRLAMACLLVAVIFGNQAVSTQVVIAVGGVVRWVQQFQAQHARQLQQPTNTAQPERTIALEEDSSVDRSQNAWEEIDVPPDPVVAELDAVLQRLPFLRRALQHVLLDPRVAPIVAGMLDVMGRLVTPHARIGGQGQIPPDQAPTGQLENNGGRGEDEGMDGEAAGDAWDMEALDDQDDFLHLDNHIHLENHMDITI